MLTGGLHLDGLADTADGLGSRRPAAAALDIMRRSDIGPMGVAALVLVLLIQVAALAAVPRLPLAAAALVLAEVTGRVAVVLATCSPPPGRAGSAPWSPAGPGGGPGAGGRAAGLCRWPRRPGRRRAGARRRAGWPPALAGLLAGWLLQRTAGGGWAGMTGDVFGAILQVSATAVLVTCARQLTARSMPLAPTA